jgi:hypothetical protein
MPGNVAFKNLSAKDKATMKKWATDATAGLRESAMMMGILDDKKDKAHRWEFELQIGHCILQGKPLVIAAAYGTKISDKLRAVADAIEFYYPGNEESFKEALRRGLEKIGHEVPRA